jgi:L-ascorbate metabolism protein UlaG (beta-lactamase superfamily)
MEYLMHLQLIRNATLRLTYAGRELLIDPWLAEQYSMPGVTGKSNIPTAALPVPLEDVVRDVELVLVSHLHMDHIDLKPTRIPTDLPILSQPNDVETLRTAGFTQVRALDRELQWQGIRITRTGGAHGTGPVGEAMGEVSGFVFQADGEPTVYWAGDTIWYDEVRRAIDAFHPDVIVTHSGGAMIQGTVIMMDTQQTLELIRAAGQATVVAVHLEAVDHATVPRGELRQAASQAGLTARLFVPEDGETLELSRPTPDSIR